MTSPDDKVPLVFGTITNPGLAGWAAMTQQDWETWMRNSVQVHIDPLESFFDMVQTTVDGLGDLINGIVSVITGGQSTGALVDDAVAALTTLLGWVRDLKTVVTKLLDGIAGVVGGTVEQAIAVITNLFRDFWAFIHGLAGSNSTVAQAIAFVKGIQTAVDAAVANLASLVNGLAGAAGASVAAAVAAVNKLKTDLQALVDGIWKAFTGGTGTGKTVVEAVTALTNWLLNAFQKLVDGIVGIFVPGAATGRPVLDAINAIGGIFGVASNADTSASQAIAAIEAIKAAQAGGFSDEFEVPLAAELDLSKWRCTSTAMNHRYGPDGSGNAVAKFSGPGAGAIQYTRYVNPLPAATGKVTATLSKTPTWDLLVKCSFYLMLQRSATINDQSCLGVEILNTEAQFFKMSAAGAQNNVGARITIPTWRVGVPYSLEYTGSGVLVLKINGILAATSAAVSAEAGRCIGFGSYNTLATSDPTASFAGISWQ